MTEFQKHLYMRCLEALSQKSGSGKIKLFSGFQELLRVWNHPGNAVINWATRSQREELKKANTKGKSSSSADNATKLFSLKFIANELKPVLENVAGVSVAESYQSTELDVIEVDLDSDADCSSHCRSLFSSIAFDLLVDISYFQTFIPHVVILWMYMTWIL